MKKIFIVLTSICLLAGAAGAETYDSPVLTPITPELIGQGGAFTAVAHGYNALFTNPAGFANEGGSLTILTVSANPLMGVSQIEAAIDEISAANFDNEEEVLNLLSGEISTMLKTNGIGANVNTGLGFVGKGIGIGVISDVEFYARGKNELGTTINAVGTVGAVAGYAHTLTISGMELLIGADIKALQRVEIQNLFMSDILQSAMGSDGGSPEIKGLHGVGIGFDAGAILKSGDISFGMSLKDIGGTKLNYTEKVINEEFLSADGDEIEDEYIIPSTLSLGVGYHLDLGPLNWLVDPTVQFDYIHTFYTEREPSFWTRLHAGTEIKILRFLKVRGGINQGYFTAGFGAKLLFIDINASYFSRELGLHAGSIQNQGLSLEFALRF